MQTSKDNTLKKRRGRVGEGEDGENLTFLENMYVRDAYYLLNKNALCFHSRRARGLNQSGRGDAKTPFHRVHCVDIEDAVQSLRIQGSFDLFAQFVMKCRLIISHRDIVQV